MRRKRTISGVAAMSALLLLGALGALGAASPLLSASAPSQPQARFQPQHASIDRDTILRRAELWVDHPVPYSHVAFATDEAPVTVFDWHAPGADLGFRADCSGYVAMAWGIFTDQNLPDQTITTKSLLFYATPITQDQLQPGDAIINATGGDINLRVGNENWGYAHAVLFVGWVPG